MKKMLFTLGAAALLVIALTPAMAEGPHDMDCMDCHTTHYAKGSYAIGVEPADDTVNPARTSTRHTAEEIDSLCLGCHNENEGILPVDLHTTHPTGIRPTYTKVPGNLLWEGRFTCVSCHNPHPSNGNHAYLIVDTKDGTEMGTFCAQCHPNQSDAMTVQSAKQLPVTSDPNVAPIVRVPPRK